MKRTTRIILITAILVIALVGIMSVAGAAPANPRRDSNIYISKSLANKGRLPEIQSFTGQKWDKQHPIIWPEPSPD